MIHQAQGAVRGWRTTLRIVRRTLVALTFFLVGVVAIIVLALQLSYTRDVIRSRVNRAIDSSFRGQLVLDRIGGIGVDRVWGVDGHLLDEQRRRVLTFRGLSVRSKWFPLVRDLATGRPLRILLGPVRLDHADVLLADSGDGTPSIANAFKSREAEPVKSKGPEQAPTILIKGFEVGHVWIHGGLPSLATIDAEIYSVTAELHSDDNGFELVLAHARLTTRAMPASLNPSGTISARLANPSPNSQSAAAVGEGANLTGLAKFEGTIADAQVLVDGDWNGPTINLSAHLPSVRAETWHLLLPKSKVRGTTAIHARVHGRLPSLHLDLSASQQSATLEVTADARVSDGMRAAAIITASDIDLSNWLPGLPSSRLTFTTRMSATFPSSGELAGDFRLVAAEGEVAALAFPSLTCTGNITGALSGTVVVSGELDVREPGAPTHGSYRLTTSAEGDTSLRAQVDVALAQPTRLQSWLGLQVTGSVRFAGESNLTRNLIVADGTAQLESVSRGTELQVTKLELQFGARGQLASPELTTRATAEQVTIGDRSLRRITAFAKGRPKLLDVGAEFLFNQQQFTFRTMVSAQDDFAMLRPGATLMDRDGPIRAQAERVRFINNGGVEITNVEISGIGDVRASALFSSRGFKSHFTAQQVDLRRVARFMGLRGVDGGKLTIDGQLGGTLENLQGHVRGQVRQLAAVGLEQGQVDLDIGVADRSVNGLIAGRLAASDVRIQMSEVNLPVTSTMSHWLEEVRGDASISGTLELEQLAPILRRLGAPIERLSGQVLLDVMASHQRSDSNGPLLHLALKTSNLRFVEQRVATEPIKSPAEARAATPRTIEGVDCDLKVDVRPRQQEISAALSMHDRAGLLLALVGEARIPNSLSNWSTRLSEMPLRVSLRVPEREIAELPAAVRPTTVRGVIAAAIDARGTLSEPSLHGQIQVRRFQPRAGTNYLDAEADLSYESSGGRLKSQARARRGGAVAVSADWKGDLLRRLRSSDDASREFFELSADATLEKFPLGLVPTLFERQIRGPLSGTIVLRGLGVDAQFSANLDGSGVTIARTAMPRLGVVVRANGSEVVASLDAMQAVGSARAELRTRSQWGARLIPKFDPNATASLVTKDFELDVLSPLVAAYLSAFEGRLDADLSIQLDPENPQLEGSAALEAGVLQLPQVGQRFSDVSAKVQVGGGEVRIESIQARGVTGRVTGDARAKLAGLQLESLDARLAIAEREKLPLTYEGVALGDAWGEATLSYEHMGGDTEFRINVPRFSLKMPEAAQREVQALDAPDDIRVGTHRADGQFVSIPLRPFQPGAAEQEEPSTTRIRVQLGDAVWIERGSQVRVQISGTVDVETGVQQRIGGRIEVKSGSLDVSGKRFEIERGVVKFDEETPPNPSVTATARYDSPAGYVVYAEYAGTAKDGKLRLRSEPVLTQDEILSLLMFGSPEGSFATSGGGGGPGGIGSADRSAPGSRAVAAGQPSRGSSASAAGAAVSVAGRTATKGLNKALSDFTTLDVSTRIDTSTGSARPELVMQVTPRLTTRITRAIGEPALGQSLDRTFLTLELRLKRSWSASAVIGDHGASRLDLIWRKRY